MSVLHDETACPVCAAPMGECDHTPEEQQEAFLRAAKGEQLVLAGDEQQVRKRAKAAAKGENRELEDLKRLMRTDLGRRFVWTILRRCGIFTSSFARAAGPEMTLHLAYFQGQHAVGLELMLDGLKHCTADYALMVSENGLLVSKNGG